MMKSRLLESIGGVDEELLEQVETAQYSRRMPVFKMLLVAAIIATLSLSVVAAQSLFADVDDGEVVSKVFKINSVNSAYELGEVYEYGGYTIRADIDTVKDVPMKLLYPYLPVVPEDWVCSGAAHAKYDDEYGMIGITWEFERDGETYEVFYRQESAYFYNKSEEQHVWDLFQVPEDMTVFGQVEMLGDARLYRVYLSATEKKNTMYQPYGQSLIFWSDGYSIFLLQVPEVMSDAEIFDLMCSLELCNSDLGVALSNLK